MRLEVVPDLAVGLDDLADTPRGGLVPLMHGRGRDQTLDIPLVGICQQADHRHRIVWLVLDVGEHNDAHLLGERQARVDDEYQGKEQKTNPGVVHGTHRSIG